MDGSKRWTRARIDSMNTPNLFRTIDKALAKAIANSGDKITCCKGCFHCCREPVYANRDEIRYILDSVSAEDKEKLQVKALTWLTVFALNGFGDDPQVSAFRYRAVDLWCPFLNESDGTCSVYDRRPSARRMHIARKPREHCENDDLRAKQEYLIVPELVQFVISKSVEDLKPGETIKHDHLGILLVEELTGKEFATKARLTVSTDANS